MDVSSEETSTTGQQEPTLLEQQAETIPWTFMDQSWTLGAHCDKKENQYELNYITQN